ncbi:MAG TPA: type II secretion system secretin GspD [Bordetella sp.]
MRRVTSFILAAHLLVLNMPVMAAQPDPKQQSSDQVTLNFADTDIPAVLRAMSLFMKRNFVVDPRVKGKLTLMSEQPVSRNEALAMLTGALRMQGYALVEVGRVTRVVPEADAKLQGSPVIDNPPAAAPLAAASPAAGQAAAQRQSDGSLESFMNASRGSEIVTRVFALKYENANNLLPVLRPLVPPNNSINAYPGNNTLVITDYADNLDRIAKVIARIDVPTAVDTDVVPIKSGIATDIASLASQMLDSQNSEPGQRITVVADPRSNSVVIRSSSPARSKLASDLVAKLDARQERAGGNMHVVYLRNAQAAHIAQVLGGLLTGRGQVQSVASANGGGGGGSGLANASPGGRASSAGLQSTSASSSNSANNSYGTSGGSGQGGLDSSQPISREDSSSGQPLSFAADGAVVQADPTTNSLVISAPDPLYRDLRTVIDQLDQRRAQVLVESLIVEVTQDASSQFGIQWMTGGAGLSGTGTSFVSGTNLGGSGLTPGLGATTLDSLGSGLSLGVIKGTTTVLGNQLINLGVLARAMQSNNQTNILSTPNLLTLDNEQASIMVGKTVPFVTGQYVTTGSGSSNPFQTIQREDVGLKLNIRPQISEGGSVKLDIYQEVSSIDTASSTAAAGIVTDKRAIDTSVLADDGDIIVLGGLLEDNVTLTTNSVPGLSSIPVLGALFKYDTRERVKTNLMVFLRPYVLRDQNASSDLTLSRYNYMRRAQSQVQPGNHWLLPDMQASILPPANLRTNAEGAAYDMRAGHLADTLRRDPPPVSQTYAVRQLPKSLEPKPSDEPIHAILPRGVGVTSDPSIMYAQEDTSTTTLQIAQVAHCEDADPIVNRIRISGLKAYSQTGPGGMSCVVRTQVARDARTVDAAIELLRELGYQSEVVQ